jgi:hypothetical protein
MDDTEQDERYADAMARRWCGEIVGPYVRQRPTTPST